MKDGSMDHRRTRRNNRNRNPKNGSNVWIMAAALFATAIAIFASPCTAGGSSELPVYLKDRGDGIPTSLFGTYIREKEFQVYLFYEYTRIGKYEYSPSELGYRGKQEYFGKVDEHEVLLFLAYAFSDSFAVEFESAVYSLVDFNKSTEDTTAVPNQIEESGLGDTEVNIRWRPLKETESRPEFTFFFKTVFPFQDDKKLIGTQDWEFESGFVMIKGFSIGTFALRGSLAYDTGENKVDFGEWAVDYVKQLSPAWRGVLSIEGDEGDEISLIGEMQYALSKNIVLKFNCGVGLTDKAPDWAPEIGILFRF